MTPAWLLPEHVEDILPPYAATAERLRRKLLDLFASYGYELVCPPLIEYLDSLLTGAARDLDLKTFKVVDGLSGRQMGLRADITPQAARIDAHLLNRKGVNRLCYAGPVLHTRPADLLASREPFQIGAELFGHAGIEADIEVLELLSTALMMSGQPQVRISVGHIGIFRSIALAAGIAPPQQHALFRALKHKDAATVEELTVSLPAPWCTALRSLPELYGGPEVIAQAKASLPATPELDKALNDLDRLASAQPGLAFDLADLRGFGYHTGVMFAAYIGGQAQAVALGGRYDGTGEIFGRNRPATGFSLDLRSLISGLPVQPLRPGIAVSHADAQALRQTMNELRAAGERVIVELPGHPIHSEVVQCDRRLVRQGTASEIIPFI